MVHIPSSLAVRLWRATILPLPPERDIGGQAAERRASAAEAPKEETTLVTPPSSTRHSLVDMDADAQLLAAADPTDLTALKAFLLEVFPPNKRISDVNSAHYEDEKFLRLYLKRVGFIATKTRCARNPKHVATFRDKRGGHKCTRRSCESSRSWTKGTPFFKKKGRVPLKIIALDAVALCCGEIFESNLLSALTGLTAEQVDLSLEELNEVLLGFVEGGIISRDGQANRNSLELFRSRFDVGVRMEAFFDVLAIHCAQRNDGYFAIPIESEEDAVAETQQRTEEVESGIASRSVGGGAEGGVDAAALNREEVSGQREIAAALPSGEGEARGNSGESEDEIPPTPPRIRRVSLVARWRRRRGSIRVD